MIHRPQGWVKTKPNRANFKVLPKEREGEMRAGRLIPAPKLRGRLTLSADRQVYVGRTQTEEPSGAPSFLPGGSQGQAVLPKDVCHIASLALGTVSRGFTL